MRCMQWLFFKSKYVFKGWLICFYGFQENSLKACDVSGSLSFFLRLFRWATCKVHVGICLSRSSAARVAARPSRAAFSFTRAESTLDPSVKPRVTSGSEDNTYLGPTLWPALGKERPGKLRSCCRRSLRWIETAFIDGWGFGSRWSKARVELYLRSWQ